MILERLMIERTEAWRDKNRPLRGVLKVTVDGTEIQMTISEQAAARILELCADGMVEAATQVAAITRAQIIDAAHLLPEHLDAKVAA